MPKAFNAEAGRRTPLKNVEFLHRQLVAVHPKLQLFDPAGFVSLEVKRAYHNIVNGRSLSFSFSTFAGVKLIAPNCVCSSKTFLMGMTQCDDEL